jgi:hypothetical protein
LTLLATVEKTTGDCVADGGVEVEEVFDGREDEVVRFIIGDD